MTSTSSTLRPLRGVYDETMLMSVTGERVGEGVGDGRRRRRWRRRAGGRRARWSGVGRGARSAAVQVDGTVRQTSPLSWAQRQAVACRRRSLDPGVGRGAVVDLDALLEAVLVRRRAGPRRRSSWSTRPLERATGPRVWSTPAEDGHDAVLAPRGSTAAGTRRTRRTTPPATTTASTTSSGGHAQHGAAPGPRALLGEGEALVVGVVPRRWPRWVSAAALAAGVIGMGRVPLCARGCGTDDLRLGRRGRACG